MNYITQPFRYLLKHPLSKKNKYLSLKRFIKWQISTLILNKPVLVPFVNDSCLLIKRGMGGATGNFYTGLQDYQDMSFLLHALRKEDLFIDIGANVGGYTILASSVVGAKSWSFEPIPETFNWLEKNVRLNNCTNVQCFNMGISNEKGELYFTLDKGSTNRVLKKGENISKKIKVPVESLDNIVKNKMPKIMKIDVEGWELNVVEGAKKVLEDCDPLGIIIEQAGNANAYNIDENEIHNILKTNGFKRVSYDPIKKILKDYDAELGFTNNTIYLKNVDFFQHRVESSSRFKVLNKLL